MAILFSFILCFLWGFPLQAEALRVTIDPGHGGSDRGAVHKGAVESQVALAVGKKLFRKLRKDPRFEAQLLRNSDRELSLEDRVEEAKRFRPDVYLSIHGNAHPTSRSVRGAEFYIQNQLPIDKERSFLAHSEYGQQDHGKPKQTGDVDSIIEDLKKSHRILKSYQLSSYMRKNWTSKKKRMIRQGPFFVLTQNSIPAVLLELGYLTHPKERKKLLSPGYQNQLVGQIHRALKDYAKNVDKLPTGILQPRNAKTR